MKVLLIQEILLNIFRFGEDDESLFKQDVRQCKRQCRPSSRIRLTCAFLQLDFTVYRPAELCI